MACSGSQGELGSFAIEFVALCECLAFAACGFESFFAPEMVSVKRSSVSCKKRYIMVVYRLSKTLSSLLLPPEKQRECDSSVPFALFALLEKSKAWLGLRLQQ